MNTPSLSNVKVAILAADGFEESELITPYEELLKAGASVSIVSPESGWIEGMRHRDKGKKARVTITIRDADPENYEALVIPGGLYNPDALRSLPEAITFVRHFAKAGKPIAAICHGPWLLIEAGLAKGRRLTSWPAIKTDIANAGGEWVDQEVVHDDNIITSRKPDDLPAFCKALIEAVHQRQVDTIHA